MPRKDEWLRAEQKSTRTMCLPYLDINCPRLLVACAFLFGPFLRARWKILVIIYAQDIDLGRHFMKFPKKQTETFNSSTRSRAFPEIGN
jgi:hypothetical protein